MNNPEITTEDLENFFAQFSGNTAYEECMAAIGEAFGDDVEVLTPEAAAEIGEGAFEKVVSSWGKIKAMFKRD